MKCEECLNSRLVLSENGWHAICTLPQEDVYDCLVHSSKFLPSRSRLYLECEEKKEGE